MRKLLLSSLMAGTGERSPITTRKTAALPKQALNIVGVSDVSVGYGSPQIPRLMESLAAHYGRQAIILEPDQTEKKPLAVPPEGCTLERVRTSAHPHTVLGRRQFVAAAARRLNEMRPDLLVVFCTYCLPVLTRLWRKPRWTIYHAIESIVKYGQLDVDVNRHLADQIDMVIFPEENRAMLDGPRTGLLRRPMAFAYNVRNERRFQPAPISQRSPRFVYTGTLDRDDTLAEHFLRSELSEIPLDIFGQPTGRDSEKLRADLSALSGRVRYHGYVPAAALDQLRGAYAYSIVMWAPTIENQVYAAPNKFFDAIADGIPPVAAPHPQCKMLIDRYQCGVLMDNWGFPAFLSALKRAAAIFGTARYEQMVANCGRAVELELNWPAQFAKVKRLLPA